MPFGFNRYERSDKLDEKTKARRRINIQTQAILQAAFPNVFKKFGQPMPLMKLGIDRDIYDRLKPMMPGISRRTLGAALAGYANHDKYLRAVVEGAPRVDLDGNHVDIVTAGQAHQATLNLAKRKPKGKADGL